MRIPKADGKWLIITEFEAQKGESVEGVEGRENMGIWKYFVNRSNGSYRNSSFLAHFTTTPAIYSFVSVGQQFQNF